VRNLDVFLARALFRVLGICVCVCMSPCNSTKPCMSACGCAWVCMGVCGCSEEIDVVNAVMYLLSDAAAMVNGTTLAVDGGYLVC